MASGNGSSGDGGHGNSTGKASMVSVVCPSGPRPGEGRFIIIIIIIVIIILIIIIMIIIIMMTLC